MSLMSRLCASLTLFLAIAGGALAAPTDAQVHAEISKLLDRLRASGCEFGRNGVWYPAAAATKHLQDKLDILQSRGPVATTESFIELGASTSSSSGKPYLVKCSPSAPVESREWLSNELRFLRAAGQPPTKP
jgi:hypothetical protein